MATAEAMAERMALELKRVCEARHHQVTVIRHFGMDMTQLHALELLEQAGLVTEVIEADHPTFRPTMEGYQAKEAGENAGKTEEMKRWVRRWVEELAPAGEAAERVVRLAQTIMNLGT